MSNISNGTSAEDEFIMVPVPKRLYPLVIQIMAKGMMSESEETGALAETQPVQVSADDPQKIDWAQVSNMKKLRKGLSLPIAIKLLDMTAASKGEPVTFEEVYTQAGFTSSQSARSSLGAFTKVIKREFGIPTDQANWPVQHHWALNGEAFYSYTMTLEVAKAWLQSAS